MIGVTLAHETFLSALGRPRIPLDKVAGLLFIRWVWAAGAGGAPAALWDAADLNRLLTSAGVSPAYQAPMGRVGRACNAVQPRI
jgi:hypothetical protein